MKYIDFDACIAFEDSAEDELPEAAEDVQPAKGHDGSLLHCHC